MDKISGLIQHIFIERGWTLSLAESCTGGAMAARLTLHPGCSQYFLGSIVSYSNQLKMSVLDVDPLILELKGAVSEEVVSQMAHHVRSLTKSDYSIAISGIAGPGGGTLDKPVGTIWAAISTPIDSHVWQFQLSGTREQIIRESVDVVLHQLFSIISHQD